ncbi:hypothetical protein LAC81_36720 (plasmid) [Ensifer adhaerens]|uniref:hypothetical protein n=1 Tax=Ensifer adhaerens TaxID=106592 RepID=UPI001CC0BE3A|nr:hypothetical protein [Ensifer adhaerens]MBZ7927484.1 hypothetical protein [Ensifer adhaerens]UAX97906.1 hypothetical protein LAC78_38025 [Ensifer adhaerens]UAY05285.1 hypothetical protein LAC80_36735 [Ensifer adhaerens]UAY12663.1 hypothetical protein LAC81_36720 [Ensifer adhaerens]
MADRGPTVINTGSSGNGGWAVAIIIALVVIGGLLLFTGVIDIGASSGGGTDVNVNVPAVESQSTDKPATSAEKPAAPADKPATAPATPAQ